MTKDFADRMSHYLLRSLWKEEYDEEEEGESNQDVIAKKKGGEGDCDDDDITMRDVSFVTSEEDKKKKMKERIAEEESQKGCVKNRRDNRRYQHRLYLLEFLLRLVKSRRCERHGIYFCILRYQYISLTTHIYECIQMNRYRFEYKKISLYIS
tara:strand:- start:832 stop:1290 length:459 start_codon:yes stop_codon:yes gene_type:complete